MRQQINQNGVVDMSDDINATNFVLEGNASVFQMLTQNVYNDPILAVMREWSTNACDACIAADLPVNYDVHIPTTDEPIFYVRDYGTGLSIPDIEGLFSTLGASTKRKSSKLNGTFGIGRMAGLATSDAFNLESYHNGILHMYTISKQDGIPVTLLLGSEPTAEPNGLKLSVGVDYKDISTYRNRVENLYKYFDYKPNLNIDDINITLDDSEHISTDWYIRPKEALHNYSYVSHNNFILMSQVLYQIPINSTIDSRGFSNLVIKAEPEKVTINPGRESLSLDTKTTSYLNQRFKEIATEYVTIAKTLLASSANDAEIVKNYLSLSAGAPISVMTQIEPSLFYSPELKSLQTSIQYNNNFTNLGFVGMNADFDAITNHTLLLSYKQPHYKTSRILKDERSEPCATFFNMATHVIVDLKTKFKAAINERFAHKSVILWQRKNKNVDVETAVKEAKKFLETLGLSYNLASEFIDQEAIEEKEKIERTGLYASPVFDSSFSSGSKIEKSNYTVGNYLYVKLKNTTPILQDTSFTFVDYMDAYRFLKRNQTMPPILGVAKKYQPLADSLPNFLDFETYIKNKCSGLVLQTGPSTSPYPIAKNALLNPTIRSNFPRDLQEYFAEYSRHNTFIDQKSFVAEGERKDLLKRLGALFVKFEEASHIDITELKRIYRYTMPLITDYSYNTEVSYIIYLAKLEKFYDLHTTK